MKVILVIALIVSAAGLNAVIAQEFPQSRKMRGRLDQSIKASDEREHDERLDKEAMLPVPKAAVMNVDVQIVLAKAEYKTFAEAKAVEAKKIVDGEPLWLYIKFKTKLGDYVLTTRRTEDREKLRYTLFAEVAPRGDITALNQYSMQFTKEDLAANELKVNLAPGLFGRNKSIPVFLMTSGAAKTGVWNNEFRLTNTVAMPRALTANLSSTPVTLDFSGGLTKYRKMDSEYDSIVLRGTTDLAKLPAAGTFFNESLATKITESLAAENIKAEKIYFSGDDWQEYASFGTGMKKIRKVFATFTYRSGAQCYYGVAEVVQDYDFMTSKYGDAEIKLQKELPAQCADAD